MAAFSVVENFIGVAQRASEVGDLRRSVEAAVTDLDVDYFAVIHHVDLELSPPGLVRMSNYPAGFQAVMARKRYFVDDPVLAVSEVVARGFLWAEVPSLLSLTERQKDILALGAREGLGAGYTHPVHVPGEYVGSCSFAVRPGRELPAERVPLLHYLGCFAFESGRRIARWRNPAAPEEALRLTDRQLDCLVLAASGATARQSAQALGIKQDTVQKHLEEAKGRAGVRSTTQLVVRTLFDGLLTFQDLIPPKNQLPS